MPQELDDRIRSVLADVLGISADQIGEDTSADTVESWDSLKHMTLILALEEEFGIRFSDDEAVDLLSYRLIQLIVEEHLAKQSHR